MRTIATLVFAIGLLLGVRVMFFGVRRSEDAARFRLRPTPFALAATLAVTGALLYARADAARVVTVGWIAAVVLVSVLAGLGAWWVVHASATSAAAALDPHEDPRYRFQGHIARVVGAIREGAGRIAFDFDGRRIEMAARWLSAHGIAPAAGSVNSEVVIERVDGDVALVEPWALVESRL